MRRFVIGQLALCLVVLGAMPSIAAAAWSIQPTPNPAGSPSAGFNAISCPALTCIAVGTYGTNNGFQPLVERWDGTSWALQDAAGRGGWSAGLAGVSCTSDTACLAVGNLQRRSSRTLVEEWDGSAWAIGPSPNPRGARASYLTAVSCVPSGACTAVGYFINHRGRRRAFTERWNGRRWSVQRAARPSRSRESQLLDVSCASPNTCFAVGSYTGLQGRHRTLAERSTGRAWRVLRTPGRANPFGRSLSAVSCPSATACMAVGDYVNRKGYSRTLAEWWDGSGWAATTTQNPGPFNFMGGVTCVAETSCLAVGQDGGNQRSDTPLAESWNGSTWSLADPVPASRQASGGLNAVACGPMTACIAVGDYARHSGDDLTLAEYGS
ncbi:MAG: hypothetical protein ACJ764_11655 [Solirubrobacteraceae bacterium]